MNMAQNRPDSPMQIREDVFQQLTETEVTEGSKNILQNLLTKDLVLAYFQEEEITEMKWKLETMKELYINLHPHADSEITGADRAYVNDAPHDTLHTLSPGEEMVIESLFMQLTSRLTRARNMKQQEMMNTQINEQRADLGDDGSSGGIFGRLS